MPLSIQGRLVHTILDTTRRLSYQSYIYVRRAVELERTNRYACWIGAGLVSVFFNNHALINYVCQGCQIYQCALLYNKKEI